MFYCTIISKNENWFELSGMSQGLHSEPHPSVQPQHLTQNLVEPLPVSLNGYNIQEGSLGPDLTSSSNPKWPENYLELTDTS